MGDGQKIRLNLQLSDTDIFSSLFTIHCTCSFESSSILKDTIAVVNKTSQGTYSSSD